MLIVTEYALAGTEKHASSSQPKTLPMPGKILGRHELEDAESTPVFSANTVFVKLKAVGEDYYWGFTDDVADLEAESRDHISDNEVIYHGVFFEGSQLYTNITCSTESSS